MKARIEIDQDGTEFITLDAENPEDHFELGALSVGSDKNRTTLRQCDGSGNIRLRMPVESLIEMAIEGKALNT